jgi:hypothetical protein
MDARSMGTLETRSVFRYTEKTPMLARSALHGEE